ncbi:unnamed protein product [Dicrocoelium dendriticum]|nr:unnamed protein product [Dicrocoelium dendriticum]
MRCTSNSPEYTVILEPGSYFLRIGRAVDAVPKKLPHCIARRVKSQRQHLRRSVNKGYRAHHGSVSKNTVVSSFIEQHFGITPPKPTDDAVVSWRPLSTLPSANQNSFSWEDCGHEEKEFLVLNDALTVSSNEEYRLTWPFKCGFMQQDHNYSAVLQDLEDIWSGACEKYLGIPRSNIPLYRVILIIGDVFRRTEIRHIVDVLLLRLRFGHLLVHQSGVCATYNLGISTACVVDVGDQKTSVSCIEDGVSHPDTRVTLAVGRRSVLHVFHQLISSSLRKNGIESTCFELQCPDDFDALSSCLRDAELATTEVLSQQDSERVTRELISPISHCVTVSLACPRLRKQCSNLPISVHTVLYSNLLPFSSIASVAEKLVATGKSGTYYECQTPSLDASQPDDPFDDLYVSLTARERRKRNLGQSNVAADANATEVTVDTKLERDETDIGDLPMQPMSHQPKDLSETFGSLAQSVWWSVCQCANLATSQIPTDTINPTASVSQTAVDEIRRRLLSCILLVGGGVCDLGGHFIRRWLVKELEELLEKNSAASAAPIEGLSRPTLEVILRPDLADAAWCGARLLLTTESINDLWFAPPEWRRLGSRLIREKAPFFW